MSLYTHRPGNPNVLRTSSPLVITPLCLQNARRLFQSEETLEKQGKRYDQIPQIKKPFLEENQEFYWCKISFKDICSGLNQADAGLKAKSVNRGSNIFSICSQPGVIHRDINTQSIRTTAGQTVSPWIDFGSVKQA